MKKRWKIRLLVSIFLLMIFMVMPFVVSQCEDSDYGKNYYVEGVVKGVENLFLGINKEVVKQDFCINSKVLREYYCEKTVRYKDFKCQRCEDGKCVLMDKEGEGVLYATGSFFSFKWLSGIVYGTSSTIYGGECGDGDCDWNEDCMDCEEDCGMCDEPDYPDEPDDSYCGDGSCDYDEDDYTCPEDCGEPDEPDYPDDSYCGDGICEGENCVTCERDCGSCEGEAYCGDNACDIYQGETCLNCRRDCGVCECTNSLDCDDNDYCTADGCSGGRCWHQKKDFPGCEEPRVVCGDNICDINEDCSTCEQDCGACGCTSNADCDDYDECTRDVCDNRVCANVEIPGCGGDLECISNDDCDDNDECTRDYCRNICKKTNLEECYSNCVNVEIPDCEEPGCTSSTDCDDYDECTRDICDDGVCVNVEIPDCGGECSTNLIRNFFEFFDLVKDECDDGNICNGLEVCFENRCKDGIPLDCDDNDECTIDKCDPIKGCLNIELDECEEVCESDSDCDTGKCIENECIGECVSHSDCIDTEKYFCEFANCERVFSRCNLKPENCPLGGGSDDYVCGCDGITYPNDCLRKLGGASKRHDGECERTCELQEDCDDNDPCTLDYCFYLKCQHDIIKGCGGNGCKTSEDCDDGDKCNGWESCQQGECKSGVPINCDDGDRCTEDTCNSRTGLCEHNEIEGCGNVCEFIKCKEDEDCKLHGSNCAIGKCRKLIGSSEGYCAFTPDHSLCDDGNECNGREYCDINYCSRSALCMKGDFIGCDDFNKCTTERCDPVKGCVYEQEKCDDGISCTKDYCGSDGCVSEPDDSLCPAGYKCDKFTGCLPSKCIRCSDCDGFFTSCDYEKCHSCAEGNCYFEGIIPGENCVSLSEACALIKECKFYSKEECGNDPCNLGGCTLKDNKCVSIGPLCGNGICEIGEDFVNCPNDCKPLEPVCGDGKCDESENCFSCKQDCGECGPYCGDGVCGNNEDCSSCSIDCKCESGQICDSGKCIAFSNSGYPPETLVMMADGNTKKISEIKEGEWVMGYYDFKSNGKKGVEVERVLSKIRGEVLEIVLEDSSFKVTEGNHLYTKDGWKKTKNSADEGVLKVGDELALDTGYKKVIGINLIGTTPGNYHLRIKDGGNFLIKIGSFGTTGDIDFEPCCEGNQRGCRFISETIITGGQDFFGNPRTYTVTYGPLCRVCGGEEEGCVKAPDGMWCNTDSYGRGGVCLNINPRDEWIISNTLLTSGDDDPNDNSNIREWYGHFEDVPAPEPGEYSLCTAGGSPPGVSGSYRDYPIIDVYDRDEVTKWIKSCVQQGTDDCDTSQQGWGLPCEPGSPNCVPVITHPPACVLSLIKKYTKSFELFDCLGGEGYGDSYSNICDGRCGTDAEGNSLLGIPCDGKWGPRPGCKTSLGVDGGCNEVLRDVCKPGEGCVREDCLECVTNEDCINKYGENFACLGNVCEKPCWDSNYCDKGERCDFSEGYDYGICVPGLCSINDDCRENQECYYYGSTKRCLENPCGENSECLDSEVCKIVDNRRNKKCVSKGKDCSCTTGNCPVDGIEGCSDCLECNNDKDCALYGSDKRCINGVCVDDCNSNKDCLKSDGAGGCISFCKESEECAQGEGVCIPKCMENCEYYDKDTGECVYVCSSEQYCKEGGFFSGFSGFQTSSRGFNAKKYSCAYKRWIELTTIDHTPRTGLYDRVYGRDCTPEAEEKGWCIPYCEGPEFTSYRRDTWWSYNPCEKVKCPVRYYCDPQYPDALFYEQTTCVAVVEEREARQIGENVGIDEGPYLTGKCEGSGIIKKVDCGPCSVCVEEDEELSSQNLNLFFGFFNPPQTPEIISNAKCVPVEDGTECGCGEQGTCTGTSCSIGGSCNPNPFPFPCTCESGLCNKVGFERGCSIQDVEGIIEDDYLSIDPLDFPGSSFAELGEDEEYEIVDLVDKRKPLEALGKIDEVLAKYQEGNPRVDYQSEQYQYFYNMKYDVFLIYYLESEDVAERDYAKSIRDVNFHDPPDRLSFSSPFYEINSYFEIRKHEMVAQAYEALGVEFSKTGNDAEAMENFQYALNHYSKAADHSRADEATKIGYHIGSARVLQLMGKYDRALMVLKEGVDRYPGNRPLKSYREETKMKMLYQVYTLNMESKQEFEEEVKSMTSGIPGFFRGIFSKIYAQISEAVLKDRCSKLENKKDRIKIGLILLMDLIDRGYEVKELLQNPDKEIEALNNLLVFNPDSRLRATLSRQELERHIKENPDYYKGVIREAILSKPGDVAYIIADGVRERSQSRGDGALELIQQIASDQSYDCVIDKSDLDIGNIGQAGNDYYSFRSPGAMRIPDPYWGNLPAYSTPVLSDYEELWEMFGSDIILTPMTAGLGLTVKGAVSIRHLKTGLCNWRRIRAIKRGAFWADDLGYLDEIVEPEMRLAGVLGARETLTLEQRQALLLAHHSYNNIAGFERVAGKALVLKNGFNRVQRGFLMRKGLAGTDNIYGYIGKASGFKDGGILRKASDRVDEILRQLDNAGADAFENGVKPDNMVELSCKGQGGVKLYQTHPKALNQGRSRGPLKFIFSFDPSIGDNGAWVFRGLGKVRDGDMAEPLLDFTRHLSGKRTCGGTGPITHSWGNFIFKAETGRDALGGERVAVQKLFGGTNPLTVRGTRIDAFTKRVTIRRVGYFVKPEIAADSVSAELAGRKMIRAMNDLDSDSLLQTTDAIGHGIEDCVRKGALIEVVPVGSSRIPQGDSLLSFLKKKMGLEKATRARAQLEVMKTVGGVKGFDTSDFLIGSDGKLYIRNIQKLFDDAEEGVEFSEEVFTRSFMAGKEPCFPKAKTSNTKQYYNVLMQEVDAFQTRAEQFIRRMEGTGGVAGGFEEAGYTCKEALIKNLRLRVEKLKDTLNKKWEVVRKKGFAESPPS
jgi:tetratricopeptide (TPR) repeat protein